MKDFAFNKKAGWMKGTSELMEKHIVEKTTAIGREDISDGSNLNWRASCEKATI